MCPTEFINTSPGLFLLLGPRVLSPTSKHVSTRALVQAPTPAPPPLRLCPVVPSPSCPVRHTLSLSQVWPGSPADSGALPLPKIREGRRARSPGCVSRRTLGQDGRRVELAFMGDSLLSPGLHRLHVLRPGCKEQHRFTLVSLKSYRTVS